MSSSGKAGKSKVKSTKAVEKLNTLPTKTIIHIKYPVMQYDEEVDGKNSDFIKVQLKTLQVLARMCKRYDTGNGCSLPIVIGNMYDSLNTVNKQSLLEDAVKTAFKSDYNTIARLRTNKLTELQFQILTVFKPVEILWYLGKLHYGIPGVEKKESEDIDAKYSADMASVTIGGLGQLDSEEFINLNNQSVDLADMVLVKRERERGKIIKNTIKTYLEGYNVVFAITNNMLNLEHFVFNNHKINIELVNITD